MLQPRYQTLKALKHPLPLIQSEPTEAWKKSLGEKEPSTEEDFEVKKLESRIMEMELGRASEESLDKEEEEKVTRERKIDFYREVDQEEFF